MSPQNLCRAKAIAGNLLVDTDHELRTVSDVSGKAAPSLAGFVHHVPRAAPAGVIAERAYTSYAEGFWFCNRNAAPISAAMPYAIREILVSSFMRGVPTRNRTKKASGLSRPALRCLRSCAARKSRVVYNRDRKGRYKEKAYLPDGRPLPALNAEVTPSLVMPASELKQFLDTAIPSN